MLHALDDPTLFARLATEASDPAMRLAAAERAGTRTWKQIFEEAAQDPRALGDAIAAVALHTWAQPEAKRAVELACLQLIRRGDESRVPEMGDLLALYGDKQLCEDYLNCGQPDLRRTAGKWARDNGFMISNYGGSNRARWGSDR